MIMVKCPKCGNKMTKGAYYNHSKIDCLEVEIENCGQRVSNIEHGIE